MTGMQCFGALLMLSAHLVISFPRTQRDNYRGDYSRQCKLCPPGQYQKSCGECADCPKGTYTSDHNAEPYCHSCFKDCRLEFHLEVKSNCTARSNVRCHCQSGFNCSNLDPDDKQICKACVKLPEPTTRGVSVVIPVQNNQTGIPFQIGGYMTTPCYPPKCGGHLTLEDKDTHETSETSKYTAAILGSVLGIAIIAIALLSCICQPIEETCFKRAVKLCNEGVRDAAPHKKDSSYQNKAEGTSSAKHHQSTAAAVANLGPVHVHSTGGTVIFSLLSHFTGQGESASEGERRPRNQGQEEKEEGIPVFHPTPSPNTHLSQEEGNREVEQIFFPSQEQGKDYHVSKEEVL